MKAIKPLLFELLFGLHYILELNPSKNQLKISTAFNTVPLVLMSAATVHFKHLKKSGEPSKQKLSAERGRHQGRSA